MNRVASGLLLLSMLAPPVAAAAPPAGGSAPCSAVGGEAVKNGIDVLAAQKFALLRGKRVGVLTNETGVLSDLGHEVDALARAPGVKLVAVFGPEHGFRGAEQAGSSEDFHVDARTKLPVYDTYEKKGPALAEQFERAGVDVIVYDIQDVGARFYTYIWTLFDAMDGAARAGKEMVVLDRPNPIGGVAVEGPVLRPEYASFVGRQPIAQRHGMTIGELARLYNGEFLPKPVRLTVVPMQGWRREMSFEQTGLPWVMPSPNMPTVATAFLFAGTGMFEGTNLSEGRGTTRPFEWIGAPFVDGRLAAEMNALKLPGVRFREVTFRPTFSKHQGQVVSGVEVRVTDRERAQPVRIALELLALAKRLYPAFAWRKDEDAARPFWIDKLTGSDVVRTSIDAGQSAQAIAAGFHDELARFRARREKYLLYPGGR